MLAISNPLKQPRIYIHLVVFLFLTFAIVGLGTTLRESDLVTKLPLRNGDAVFALGLPSPTSEPVAKIVPKVAGTASSSNEGQQQLDDKSETPISTTERSTSCKDKNDPWTIVPNGDDGEIYTICNVKTEKMATVDELNVAQNNYRAGQGKSRLNINSGLCTIAASRASAIAKNFTHSGFESAVKGSGLGFSSYGENIASGPLSATRFVEWSWDKSPGHRANMLGDWSDGCGGVWDKYAVFLFAK